MQRQETQEAGNRATNVTAIKQSIEKFSQVLLLAIWRPGITSLMSHFRDCPLQFYSMLPPPE